MFVKQKKLGRRSATKLSLFVSSGIVEEFEECFEGAGKLRWYQLKSVHVKEDVANLVQPLRRPSLNMMDRIENTLHEPESTDIIEKVNSPSPWVSPVVAVPKPNTQVTLCVDMRQANCAVECERYPIHVLQDMIHS